MANLQIKGVDDALYEALKQLATSESRSVSRQTLCLIRDYLAKRPRIQNMKTPVQVLLELAGSWEGQETAEELITRIKKAHKGSAKLKQGF